MSADDLVRQGDASGINGHTIHIVPTWEGLTSEMTLLPHCIIFMSIPSSSILETLVNKCLTTADQIYIEFIADYA